MNAAAVYASWLAACGLPCGGDNLLRHQGALYCIDPHPLMLKNGAIVGRIHRHTRTGFTDLGAFKIAANGTVEHVTAELRGVLPGTATGGEAAGAIESAEIVALVHVQPTKVSA